EIDDDRSDIAAERMAFEDRVETPERAIEKIHEQPAHQVYHQNGAAVGEGIQPRPGARRPRREIGRAQDARVAVDRADQLALIPHMVPGGQDVGPGLVKLARQLVGKAKAVRRVLGVDDREVEREAAPQSRQMRRDGISAGFSDDVTAQEDIQQALRDDSGWSRLGRRLATPSWPAVAGGYRVSKPRLRQGQFPRGRYRPRG